MTVNSTKITSGPYVGNNVADTFSYTFKVDDKTQLSVFETTDLGVETLLTVDTDYTVAGIGNDGGGTITRVDGALPTDYEWFIRSNYEETQLTAFSSQGAFFPDLHENAMDKMTFLIQQLLDEKNRSPKVSNSYTGDLPLTLDEPVAGKILKWNGTEDGLENTSITELDPEVIDATTLVFGMPLAQAVADVDAYVGKVVTVSDRGNGFFKYIAPTANNGNNLIDATGSGLTLSLLNEKPTATMLGIIGDGATDQSAAVLILDSLSGVIDVANIFVDADIELTNIATFRGGYLKPANTRTITINDIDAPLQRIFDISVGGEIVLNNKWASATWFNAQEGLIHDNGPIINAAIRACGRAGTVEFQTKDINTRYTVTSEGIVCDFDEFTLKGEQFRVRIGTEVDIPVFTQNIRAPSPYFGLNLRDIDFFNNVASGSSHVVNLNASFLFILDNVYIDKGPANGFQFNGICAQGEIRGCIAEELQGDGFREVSGSVMLSYTNCQSFENGGVGFGSGNNTATYGNSLVGCKAYLNGVNNFNRGDAGVSISACMSRNAGAVGIVLGSSAHNASVKGTPSFDDRGSPVQTYGYEINHYSQDIDTPMGDGNVTGLVLNNEAQPLLTIASGAITLPSIPQNAIIRVDTESAAASDRLESISRGYTNQVITIKAADSARDVIVSDEFNNLSLAGDFTLTNTKDRITLQYDRTENRWVELSRSDNQA